MTGCVRVRVYVCDLVYFEINILSYTDNVVQWENVPYLILKTIPPYIINKTHVIHMYCLPLNPVHPTVISNFNHSHTLASHHKISL